jgi:hypothetical protein
MKLNYWTKRILSCAVLGLALPCFAGDQVPFKGNASLMSKIEGLCAGGVLFSVSGGGYVTQLGAMTVSETVCMNPNTLTFTGDFTLAAANGDTVSARIYTGQGTPTAVANVVSVLGFWRITGGTGRFAGATGSGKGFGTVNLVTGEAPHRVEGTISNVGSNMN